MTGISCLSGKQKLFPGFPCLCHISPHRLFSWQSTPVLSLGSDLPKPKPQHPVSSCLSRHADKHLRLGDAAWYQCLCGILYTFPSAQLHCSSLRLWSSTVSTSEGVWMYGKLSSFRASSQKHRSHHDSFLSLALFHYFFCPYSIMGKSTDLFGSLWSSASFQLML